MADADVRHTEECGGFKPWEPSQRWEMGGRRVGHGYLRVGAPRASMSFPEPSYHPEGPLKGILPVGETCCREDRAHF